MGEVFFSESKLVFIYYWEFVKEIQEPIIH